MARLRVKTQPTAKRIRALRAGADAVDRGHVALDTINALLVWEHDRYPHYYIPRSDVTARIEAGDPWDGAPDAIGDARREILHFPGGTTMATAAWSYLGIDELADYVRFDWSSFHWFEEDELVQVHPRSPHVRVDCLPSSRHVRIEADGQTIASCHSPVLVFETGLPTRVYIPITSTRIELFVRSSTETACPYKGTASYFSLDRPDAERIDDVCWSYATPVTAAAPIAGLLGFHHEKVDVFIDGKRHTGT